MTKEENEPLYIKEKLIIPRANIRNHSIIYIDPQLSPRYLEKQEHAIIHLKDILG